MPYRQSLIGVMAERSRWASMSLNQAARMNRRRFFGRFHALVTGGRPHSHSRPSSQTTGGLARVRRRSGYHLDRRAHRPWSRAIRRNSAREAKSKGSGGGYSRREEHQYGLHPIADAVPRLRRAPNIRDSSDPR